MPEPELRKWRHFVCLQKRDDAKQEVWGVATAEVPDSSNEIFDYDSSKPHFLAWSQNAQDITGGRSKGNLREMHSLIAAGRLLALDCDDAKKEIRIHAKVVDPITWLKVTEDVLPCFSIGGSYLANWEDPTNKKYTRFTAKPSEISLVDLGAVPVAVVEGWKAATVEIMKADGSITSKLVVPEGSSLDPAPVAKKAKTKRVDGEDLPSSAFIIVGDADDTSTWKLPWKFSSESRTRSHLRNALARFSQLKDVDEETKKKAWSKLKRLCGRYGIKVTDAEKKAERVEVAKSLYTVSRLAEMLQSIRYIQSSCEYEGDAEDGDERDYALADRIHEWLVAGAEILPDMLDEELEELTAEKAAVAKGDTMTNEELQKKKFNAAAAFKKMAAHHEKMAECHKADAEGHDDMMEAHKACKVSKADVGGDDNTKEFHVAGVAFHKAKAANCMKLHKAHSDMAEMCNKVAEGYENGSMAPEGGVGGDPVGGKEGTKAATAEELTKAAEAALAKKAAEDAAAAELAKKKAEEEANNPLMKTMNTILEKLAALEAKPVPPPAGLHMVPRFAKATGTDGAAAVSDDDTGI